MAELSIDYSYKDVSTVKAFSRCNDDVRLLTGPFGSGKSTGCVMEIIKRAHAQSPGADGVRRSRWAIIRNSYRQLEDTTIKTFLDWLPPKHFGAWRSQKHEYEITAFPDVHIEVLFRSLDRPDQVDNLLSLELTGAWINEARETPKQIFDALTGRVNRFPAKKDGGCTWAGVFMDTNPPDDDHWLYRMFEEVQPEGWSIFKQPSGRSDKAENLSHLPADYYQRLMRGKDDLWIKVYVDGEYGSTVDGKPIYPEFSDKIHVSDVSLNPYKGLPLLLGFDFGLTPACVISQVTPRGQLRVLRELVSEDMGIRQFSRTVVKPFLANNFPGVRVQVTGDPAGEARAQTDERTCFDELEAAGLKADPARTNDFTSRREAVAGFLTRLVDGEPAFLLDPSCKVTRKGFNGGYRYRRMQVPGEERYADKPDKNRFSHIHDGLQYSALYVEVPVTETKRRVPVRRQSYSLPDSSGY